MRFSRYSFEGRSRVIGSSDATKIMGDGDDWLELFRQKTDKAFYEKTRKGIEAAIIVRAGRALERVNLDIIGEKLGRVVEPVPEEGFADAARPFLVAMPDGVYRDLEYEGQKWHGLSPVEVKACGGWQDAEERFRFYYPQIQHEIHVMDAPGCLFGLMIGTTAHYTTYAGRDDDFLKVYLERCDRFMDEHLLVGVYPEPSTEPPPRYVIPEGLVPRVIDKSDDADWQMVTMALADEAEAKADAEERISRYRARAIEMFRSLRDVKQVKVGTYRFSVRKDGVLTVRNVEKEGE